jgi:hypothetical protein
MPTPGDDGPSVFSKYIGGPEIERPSPLEKVIRQSRRGADIKTFLTDILAAGPVAATLIKKRGAAHGFSKGQIWCAKQHMNIVAFKETRPRGRWFWVFSHDNRGAPAQRAGF